LGLLLKSEEAGLSFRSAGTFRSIFIIPATFPAHPVKAQGNQNAAPEIWLGAATQTQFLVREKGQK